MAVGVGAEFPRSAHQAFEVVEASLWVDETFLAGAVGFELQPHVRGQPQQQLLGV